MSSDCCFEHVRAKFVMRMHPQELTNVKKRIHAHLNVHLMKYMNALDGVLVAYKNVSAPDFPPLGSIFEDIPYIHFKVTTKLVVFRPPQGALLDVLVNYVTPEHVGALAFGTFNVSINASSLKKNGYSYDSASNTFTHKSRASVNVGSQLTARCDDVQVRSSIITIRASCVPSGSPVLTKKKIKRSKSSQENGAPAPQDPNTTPPSTPPKKSRGENESQAETSTPPPTPTPTPGRPKKKRRMTAPE